MLQAHTISMTCDGVKIDAGRRSIADTLGQLGNIFQTHRTIRAGKRLVIHNVDPAFYENKMGKHESHDEPRQP